MRLSVLEDFLRYCDPVTFCPSLHSILILDDELVVLGADDDDDPPVSYDVSKATSGLSCFFSHCSHLKEVSFNLMKEPDDTHIRHDSVIYAALYEQLRDNQLVKADFRLFSVDEVVCNDIINMLSKHVNSLKEIKLVNHTKQRSGVVCLLENLIKYKNALHVLDIELRRGMVDYPIPLLLQYVSSSGMFLKELDFQYEGDNAILTDQLLLLIGTSCPNLEVLSWIGELDSNASIESVEIYQLCPNLKCIRLPSFIFMNVDEKKNMLDLSIYDDTRLVESMEYVLLALERGQYSEAGLSVSHELEDEEWKLVLKTIGPMITSLEVEVTEDALVDLLPNLPLLQKLDVTAVGTITDRSMVTIARHGQKL
eukprot:scaffold3894_cov165-Ochromonas_danica.AAC.1